MSGPTKCWSLGAIDVHDSPGRALHFGHEYSNPVRRAILISELESCFGTALVNFLRDLLFFFLALLFGIPTIPSWLF